MDNFFRSLILFLFSFSVFAGLPKIPTWNVSRVGASSTFKLADVGYSPPSFAPVAAFAALPEGVTTAIATAGADAAIMDGQLFVSG